MYVYVNISELEIKGSFAFLDLIDQAGNRSDNLTTHERLLACFENVFIFTSGWLVLRVDSVKFFF